MNLPDNVQLIISTLESGGYEAFVVGGCVRDAQRGVVPKDWDIATSATPHQAKALFSRTVDTGIKHGTITVVLDRSHYEVTTYRIDGEYLDNRRPASVTFSGCIEEDLSRRDFTMNAIAYNPNKGFVDPFHGRRDIKNRIIRCVGNPAHRFAEDALRMLRAIRFAGVTGFVVDDEILLATSRLKENLQDVSPERIREELGKLITSPHPQAITMLDSTGLLPFVLGREYEGDLAQNIRHLQVCPPLEPLRLAVFLQDDSASVLKDLRFDNKTIREVCQYARFLPAPLPIGRYEIKKLLRVLPREHFENLLILKNIVQPEQKQLHEQIHQEIEDIFCQGECFTLKDLAVNGSDLAQLGIAPGEAMGNILEELLDAVMRDADLNCKGILLDMVKFSWLALPTN